MRDSGKGKLIEPNVATYWQLSQGYFCWWPGLIQRSQPLNVGIHCYKQQLTKESSLNVSLLDIQSSYTYANSISRSCHMIKTSRLATKWILR